MQFSRSRTSEVSDDDRAVKCIRGSGAEHPDEQSRLLHCQPRCFTDGRLQATNSAHISLAPKAGAGAPRGAEEGDGGSRTHWGAADAAEAAAGPQSVQGWRRLVCASWGVDAGVSGSGGGEREEVHGSAEGGDGGVGDAGGEKVLG